MTSSSSNVCVGPVGLLESHSLPHVLLPGFLFLVQVASEAHHVDGIPRA